MAFLHVKSAGINADVVHLFHGKDFTRANTVGCTSLDTLCDTNGLNAAVNLISFSDNLSSQSKLLAHENGHLCGAGHVINSTAVTYGTLQFVQHCFRRNLEEFNQ
jgi:hypothetical protein